MRYGSRSRKKELIREFCFALDFPFAATWLPILKSVLAGVVPSDDPLHVVDVDAARFARAASMDLAIAASMGRTCSETALLFVMRISPYCPHLGGLNLSTAEEADLMSQLEKTTSNNPQRMGVPHRESLKRCFLSGIASLLVRNGRNIVIDCFQQTDHRELAVHRRIAEPPQQRVLQVCGHWCTVGIFQRMGGSPEVLHAIFKFRKDRKMVCPNTRVCFCLPFCLKRSCLSQFHKEIVFVRTPQFKVLQRRCEQPLGS